MHDFHGTFRDLLHAANLRHGTHGFTSLPKEGVLRIFSPLKNRRLRPGLNPRTYSNTIFKLKKRVIRIMMNAGNRESCRELFKKLNILPIHSQYILSLLLFVVKNINMFKSNSVIYSTNTRHCSDLYLPSVHLSKVQKGVYQSGIKVFNCLPPWIKSLSEDTRKFKSALKRFL